MIAGFPSGRKWLQGKDARMLVGVEAERQGSGGGLGGGSSDEGRVTYSATLGEEPWHAHGLLTNVSAVFFTP